MPLYEDQCDVCGHRFEVIQKFSDPPGPDLPDLRRTRSEAALVARDPVQGHRVVHHRLRAQGRQRRRRRERLRRGPAADGKSDEGEASDGKASRQRPRASPADTTSPRRPRRPRVHVDGSIVLADQHAPASGNAGELRGAPAIGEAPA